jgi:hypothetical protein
LRTREIDGEGYQAYSPVCRDQNRKIIQQGTENVIKKAAHQERKK